MTTLLLLPRFIFTILFAQLLLSCGQQQENSKTTSTESISSENISSENIPLENNQISIDTFSTFPPEIDGCACYFSNDSTEFKNGKYIYADAFGKNAFVSINGVMTKFVLSKTETFPADHTIKTFINDKYEITIDVKQVGQLDETWQQAGTIKIKPKEGTETIKNIYGECGC